MSGLSVAGAGAVARVLAANRILTDLDISSCRIRDASTVVIARALSVNDALSTLRVSLRLPGSELASGVKRMIFTFTLFSY